MGLVRESISFQRGLDPKQALGVGLDNFGPWEAHDYIVKIFREDYFVEPSDNVFEDDDYYHVIWNIGISHYSNIEIFSGKNIHNHSSRPFKFDVYLILEKGLKMYRLGSDKFSDKEPIWRGPSLMRLIEETKKYLENNK